MITLNDKLCCYGLLKIKCAHYKLFQFRTVSVYSKLKVPFECGVHFHVAFIVLYITGALWRFFVNKQKFGFYLVFLLTSLFPSMFPS